MPPETDNTDAEDRVTADALEAARRAVWLRAAATEAEQAAVDALDHALLTMANAGWSKLRIAREIRAIATREGVDGPRPKRTGGGWSDSNIRNWLADAQRRADEHLAELGEQLRAQEGSQP